jgi:hypothetical protein
MGCPNKVGTVGIDPFVIMTENYTQNGGSIAYRVTGLSVEILQLVCEKKKPDNCFPCTFAKYGSGLVCKRDY